MLLEKINIDINIDRLPLVKSSKIQLWPILIRANNINGTPVFPVAICLGNTKPQENINISPKISI